MLTIGNYIQDVKCENFLDSETNRIRVRPLSGQGLPTDLVIECSKHERERHPLGTKFITYSAKVCIKPNGRIYLRAQDQMIHKL
jgi:hypothetical protein